MLGDTTVPGDGKTGPCRTIIEAVRRATVSSRVSIAHTGADYLESVNIAGFNNGRPSAPPIIEGNGGLFERNGGCGICDVQNCITVYRNVTVRNNLIAGAMPIGMSHSFINCTFYGNQGREIAGSDGGGEEAVAGDNIRIIDCKFVNCKER
jgi:hypothetical protein